MIFLQRKFFLLPAIILVIITIFWTIFYFQGEKEEWLISPLRNLSNEIYWFKTQNQLKGFEGFCQSGKWLEIKENLSLMGLKKEKIQCVDRKNDFCIVVPSFKEGYYCLDRFKFKEFRFLSNHQCSNTNPVCFSMDLAPKLTLSAAPIIVKKGFPLALMWDSENTSACYWLDGLSEEAGIRGSINVFPSQKTTYLLKCDGPEGSVESSITIKISETN